MEYNVVAIRTRRGMSQAELARRAGVSRNYLCKVEKGNACPTVRVAGIIAAVLECTVDEAFIRKEEEG